MSQVFLLEGDDDDEQNIALIFKKIVLQRYPCTSRGVLRRLQ